jgi:hypothetical protein
MDLQGLSSAMPVNRIAPLARPGMAVRLCDQRSDTGQIIYCLPEACIVRGNRGEVCAISWGEVDLIGVVPDPACTVPTGFTWKAKRKPAKSRKPKGPAAPAGHFPRIHLNSAARV